MCKCIICGKEDYKIDTSKFPKDFCSYSCYQQWLKFNKEPNTECPICHTKFYVAPNRLKRAKHGVCCSKECSGKLKSLYSSGRGNHQYGLRGDKNASFKGNVITLNGYLYEYCPGHPHASKTSRVRQHRLVIEHNYKLYDSKYFETIDNWIVLKQCYDVHHINENKQDNRIDNLQIVTKSEHTAIHNLEKEIIRDDLGRITGVIKLSNNSVEAETLIPS